MRDFAILADAKFRTLRNSVRTVARDSRLKTYVILFTSFFLWISMFAIFSRGYQFIERFPDVGVDFLTEYLFGIMFLALTLMLVISGAIISFTSFFKSRESLFLVPTPVRAGSMVLYKMIESVGFSSWAFLFLVIPFFIAYGVHRHLVWYFYPLSIITLGVFIFIPASIGSIIALVIGRFLPRRKREAILMVILSLVVITVVVGSNLIELRGVAHPFTTRWMEEILNKFSIAQNPISPSYWLVQCIMASAKGEMGKFAFFFGFMLSWAMFLLMVVHFLSNRMFLPAFSLVQSTRLSRRKYRGSMFEEWVNRAMMVFFTKPVTKIIIKDFKSLVRDPVQWSQSLVFFGLLGVYFLNLRNLPQMQSPNMFWQNLVAYLNLLATCLTLATFTTRFIYPQLSLEGQRFWVIGMAPVERKEIVYGKFYYSMISCLLLSETLILTSNIMLMSPWYYTLIQAYIMFIVCAGLSAIAVGLGTLYPNIKEDNPSKIVAGFGGTLTLVLSIIFVMSVIMINAFPPYAYYQHQHFFRKDLVFLWLMATGVISFIGLIATTVPLYFSLKAIDRMEV